MIDQVMEAIEAIDVEEANSAVANAEQELERVVAALGEADAKVRSLDVEISATRKDDANELAGVLLSGGQLERSGPSELELERDRYRIAIRGLKTRENELHTALRNATRAREKLIGEAVEPFVEELAEIVSEAAERLCRVATTAMALAQINGRASRLGLALENVRFPLIHARLGQDLEAMQHAWEKPEQMLAIARHATVKELAPSFASLEGRIAAALPN